MKSLALVVLFAVFLFGLFGCQPSIGSAVLKDAEVVNTTTVKALTELQESTRAARKAALEAIARTASSEAQGKRDMDALDRRHARLVGLLEKAETAQNGLADLLDAASSGSVDLDAIIVAYTLLESLYATIAKEAASWTKPAP